MELQETTEAPFIIQLIDELKKQEFISSGIMLPLVLGAYKVKEDFKGDNYLQFIEYAYNDMMESLYKNDRYLYFRECEASHNFVFELCDIEYKSVTATIFYKGKPVIYCNDPVSHGVKQELDAHEAFDYFLNKILKQAVRYCNFIDTIIKINDDNTSYMQELNKKADNELGIIKSILSK